MDRQGWDKAGAGKPGQVFPAFDKEDWSQKFKLARMLFQMPAGGKTAHPAHDQGQDAEGENHQEHDPANPGSARHRLVHAERETSTQSIQPMAPSIG